MTLDLPLDIIHTHSPWHCKPAHKSQQVTMVGNDYVQNRDLIHVHCRKIYLSLIIVWESKNKAEILNNVGELKLE